MKNAIQMVETAFLAGDPAVRDLVNLITGSEEEGDGLDDLTESARTIADPGNLEEEVSPACAALVKSLTAISQSREQADWVTINRVEFEAGDFKIVLSYNTSARDPRGLHYWVRINGKEVEDIENPAEEAAAMGITTGELCMLIKELNSTSDIWPC